MSHCIGVTLKDGSTVMANVADETKRLHPDDIAVLEQWVAHVKARQAKRNKSVPKRKGDS